MILKVKIVHLKEISKILYKIYKEKIDIFFSYENLKGYDKNFLYVIILKENFHS